MDSDKNPQKKGSEADELGKQLEEYTILLQRLQADFENHLKRSEAERRELVRNASKGLVVRLLDVVDTMDAALKVQPKGDGEARILDGFRKVHSQLMSVLSAEGVLEIPTEKFDHDFHEAVETVADKGKSDGTVIDVIQKGYMLNGKVIRASKVVVVKNGGVLDG
ncbi:MAG: nucleotide exchange factor GrpE [Candidatus Altiarchaeota archaeon]